jgi:hypothetical protein
MLDYCSPCKAKKESLSMICRAMFGGEESFLPDWEDSLMPTSTWYQRDSPKQLLQGAALARHRIQLGRVHAWKYGEDVGGQHRQ